MTGVTWVEKPYDIIRKDASNIEVWVKVDDTTVVLVFSDHEARIFAHEILKEAK